MGVQKTAIQKSYEMPVGSNTIDVDFLGSNRQSDWLEICLVFDKSNKHTTIYDSYNVELAAKYIKSLKLSNFTEIQSLTNEKYDTDNVTQKHLLYKQLVAWACNGCSMTPLTDYINNTIYEELLDKPDYDSDTSNESIYLDLRIIAGYTTEMEKLERKNSKINLVIQLEKAATKNLRSRIWAYSLGVYLYVLS